MQNGLYKVEFSYGGDSGAGVLVLTDGRVRGGDTSFTYIGTLDHQGGGASGIINVSRHSPGLPNIFGVDNYQLTVNGKATDTQMAGTAETAAAPGATLSVKIDLIAAD